MRVMAFASQKGGSGKTTLAGHIAVQAESVGAGPVAIIDTDPQGSLSDWWNARRAQTPVFAQTFISRLGEDLQKMRDIGVKLLVFDTPPAITATIEQVIRVCDLVVIPTPPSPHDLRAVHSRQPGRNHVGANGAILRANARRGPDSSRSAQKIVRLDRATEAEARRRRTRAQRAAPSGPARSGVAAPGHGPTPAAEARGHALELHAAKPFHPSHRRILRAPHAGRAGSRRALAQGRTRGSERQRGWV